MLWLLLVFIVLALVFKATFMKKDSWGEALASVFTLLLLTAIFWVPITERIPSPGTEKTISYNAYQPQKPSVKTPSTSDKYMDVVETVSEAKPGTKKVYRSLILNSEHETVLTKAEPAVYAVKTVENPNYQPPKPVYTPPQPTYTPPVQNQSRCPITTCCDGTCSRSRGRGTCSWHGGVCG